MRQEHNQAHRTPPVPHSGSLCAPSYRVPKPRFSSPGTVRGLRGKKEFGLLLARAETFGLVLALSGFFCCVPAARPGRVCVACCFLCCALRVSRFAARPIAYHFSVVEVAFGSHTRHAFIYSLSSSARYRFNVPCGKLRKNFRKPGHAGVHPFCRSCDTFSTRARSGWLR